MSKITLDPVTRIEGHLKIEVEVEKGVVKDAWSSGTLFRGFERMLKDRDPLDAWFITQRICGVCPVSHGHTSSMALEDAFQHRPPENAIIIRNLIEGGQFLHSHILWFYILSALDYVDVVSALSAKPKEKSLQEVQRKLKTFVDSGQLGPFANAYWGHQAYKLPPELNLLAVAHYLQALEMQAKASHLTAIFGGKMPMHMSTPPGGVTVVPSVGQLKEFLFRLREIQDFIDNVFLPDLLAIAPYYLDWKDVGRGVGNYLAWGVFEDVSFEPSKRLMPRGAILKGSLEVVQPDSDAILEYVKHSWYSDSSGGRHPGDGQTEPKYTGFDPDGQYSWVKAPRLDGRPMEVGALSRVLVAYLSGQEDVKNLVDSILAQLNLSGQVTALLSVVGRMAARAVEIKVVADAMEKWCLTLVENVGAGNMEFFTSYEMPDSAQGVGLWEAPRGALAHFCNIEGGLLANYQCVVPSTWNASPRDGDGVRGPMEQALIGTPVADPDKPLEVLRVVHSFDPCIACAVHIIHPQTNQVKEFWAVL